MLKLVYKFLKCGDVFVLSKYLTLEVILGKRAQDQPTTKLSAAIRVFSLLNTATTA